MKVSRTMALKVNALVRPLGYAAAPEILVIDGFDLPLLALTEQRTRTMILAIRIGISASDPRRWRERDTYLVRELVDYAQYVGRPAHVIVSCNLKPGTPVVMIEARTALVEAVDAVTVAKQGKSDFEEKRRWAVEATDLLA